LTGKYNAEGSALLTALDNLYPRQLAQQQRGERDYAQMTSDLYTQIYGPLARQQSALANSAQREADVADFERLGERTTNSIVNADPEQAALRHSLNSSVMGELAYGAQLNPVDLRRAQQQARSNRTQQGFGQGSNNDLLAEAINIATQGEGLRRQRQQSALEVGAFNQRTAGDAFMAVTGRPSGAMGFAANAYGQGAAGSPNYDPFTNSIAHDSYSMLESYDLNNMLSKRNAATARRGLNMALVGAGLGAGGQAAGAFM